MEVEEIARVCHEVNRGLCEALGDFSQVRWGVAPEWQRQSAIHGVQHAQDDTIEPHPSDSHANWMGEKLADGWTYGPEKNEEAKTHPCLVDFHDLPKEQQLKDHLFLTVVKLLS